MQRTLDTFINRKQLSEMLGAFADCVGLPIQLVGPDGEPLEAYGEASGYCALLHRGVFPKAMCCAAHRDAGLAAQALGEPYIFACHANANHIAFPLLRHEGLLGIILVGPFLMDAPDSTLIVDLAQRQPVPSATLLELYDELSHMKVVRPERVKQISRLLYFLVSPLLPEGKHALAQNREKLYQQARIGETIQMYKAQSPVNEDPYPYEKEKELLTKVKTGDAQQAKGVLNDLLGYVFFCEGGRMETMKNRALELCALLSRTAIEGGAVAGSIFRLNNQFLYRLLRIDTLESLCYEMQEIVEAFMEAAFQPGGGPGHESVRKAVAYIARHYSEPLTLPRLADHVGLSAAYFSSLFKQRTGSTFREYLNQVRVEESKRLLSMTEYSLVDIAIAMGFGDQSYYSKVFKKYTGLTPRQYR